MVHMDRSRRNFVSEASRRTSVNRPERPFTPLTALRPGEDVPIDTNKLDIMCRYADGVIRGAELTMAVDAATRTILAGIIAPTTKAVDAAAVLARMLVPEPMRPGWSEALRMSASLLPHARLVDIDARIELAAARPVIVPDTIVIDGGKVFLSDTFTRACDRLGVSVQRARPRTPTDKAVVSHCTSGRGLGQDSSVEAATEVWDQPRVAGCRGLVELLVLVVGLVRDEEAGAVPVLDRVRVHVQPVSDLGEGEQAAVA
jgi:hypothetical protein